MNQEINDITEGNKLIAEFMGWTIEKGMEKEENPYYNKGWGMCQLSQFPYQEDWSALMTVVQKIVSGASLKSLGEIDYELLEEMSFGIFCLRIHANIKTVWNECIEFIEWYNNQNKGNLNETTI